MFCACKICGLSQQTVKTIKFSHLITEQRILFLGCLSNKCQYYSLFMQSMWVISQNNGQYDVLFTDTRELMANTLTEEQLQNVKDEVWYWCGTLKRLVWYFEEGGVVLLRGWCGTLKRVVWYFEEGCVVH